MIRFGQRLNHQAIKGRISVLLKTLSEKEDVMVIYLFGSMAIEIADELSDVDIAVLLKGGGISIEEELDLIETITSTLHTDEVSLVVLNNAPLCVRYGVIREARVLFSRDEDARLEFEESVCKQYMDFKYYLDIYDREFIALIKETIS